MKKILILLLILSLGCMQSINAMTKEQFTEKLSQTYNINGYEFKASKDHLVQLERYLNQNELSESDMDYISEKFDEAIEILKSEPIRSIEEVTISQKSKLIPIVNDISSKTSVKATVSKNTIIIYNLDGTEFTRVTFLVKQTGRGNIYVMGSLGIVLLGFWTMIRKKKENV